MDHVTHRNKTHFFFLQQRPLTKHAFKIIHYVMYSIEVFLLSFGISCTYTMAVILSYVWSEVQEEGKSNVNTFFAKAVNLTTYETISNGFTII